MLRWFYNTDHKLRLAEALELHNAIGLREECIISSTTDIPARKKPGPTLADEDTAARDRLSAKPLHAEALCIAIAAIPRTSHSFFMCHFLSPIKSTEEMTYTSYPILLISISVYPCR